MAGFRIRRESWRGLGQRLSDLSGVTGVG